MLVAFMAHCFQISLVSVHVLSSTDYLSGILKGLHLTEPIVGTRRKGQTALKSAEYRSISSIADP
jgi:hypothetical protein